MSLEEILLSDDVVDSINNNLDYLISIIPEIKNMIGFEHKNPHHHLDVWNHTLLALSLSEKNFIVRLSLLLHDIGKPFSYQEDGDIRHFHNHPIESALMAKEILTRLGYDYKFITGIYYLVLNHDNPILSTEIENDYDLECIRFKIQICDTLAHNPEELELRKRYILRTTNKFIKYKINDSKKYILH